MRRYAFLGLIFLNGNSSGLPSSVRLIADASSLTLSSSFFYLALSLIPLLASSIIAEI